MDKKVTVLTPNGRRHVVGVSPNTTLLQILETTCDKYGFNSEEFCLKHHRKDVGLTQMFRFSGLPNNCLLEMEPAEQRRELKNVDICLQLENGQRLQGKYCPTKTLLDVVEELSSDKLLAYESPVLLYMRQEIIGREAMGKTTLKNLGITEGRAMIRLVNKKPEQLKVQANVYIPPKVQETPKEGDDDDDDDDDMKPRSSKSAKCQGLKTGGFAITKDLVRTLKNPIAPDSDSSKDIDPANKKGDKEKKEEADKPEKPKYDWGSGKGQSIGTNNKNHEQNRTSSSQPEVEEDLIEPEYIVIGDRNAILYSLDSAQKDDQELPDSFFELTVHDLKLILRDLKKISSGSEDTPLQTEKMREMQHNQQMLRKIGLYKNCIIRVQFPDRLVLQGMFNPTDTIDTIHKWLKAFLKNSKENFHLYTIPPKTILMKEKNLLDLDLIPNALVHFSFDEDIAKGEQIYLKKDLLKKLTSPSGAIFAAQKFRNINKNARSYNSDDVEEMDIDDQPTSSRNSP